MNAVPGLPLQLQRATCNSFSMHLFLLCSERFQMKVIVQHSIAILALLLCCLAPTPASALAVVVPCGADTTYNEQNTSRGTQFYIGHCPGRTFDVATNSFMLIATVFQLVFDSAAIPSDVIVVVEHSASVNIVLRGRRDGTSTISNFSLIMTNVTSPFAPIPPLFLCACILTCSVNPSEPWCRQVVYVDSVTLYGGRFILRDVSYLRGVNAMMTFSNFTTINNLLIHASNSAHSGIMPFMFVDGTRTAASVFDLDVMLTNTTVVASGTALLASVLGVSLLQLQRASLTSGTTIISNVTYVDVGVSGPVALVALSSAQCQNVAIIITNTTVTLRVTTFFTMLYMEDTNVSQSSIVARNTTTSGTTSSQVGHAMIVSSTLSQRTVLHLEDSVMVSDVVMVISVAGSTFSSGSSVALSAVRVQAVSAGALLYIPLDGVASTLSNASIGLYHCQGSWIGSSFVSRTLSLFFLSGARLNIVTAVMSDCILIGESDASVLVANSANVVEHLHLSIARCRFVAQVTVYLSNLVLRYSTVEVRDSALMPYSDALLLSNVSASHSSIAAGNITTGVLGWPLTQATTFWFQLVTLRNTSMDLRPNQTTRTHAGPVLQMINLAAYDRSHIVMTFIGDVIHPSNVDSFLIAIHDATLDDSSVTITLPHNITSLAAFPTTENPFHFSNTVLSQRSSLTISGQANSVMRWPSTLTLFQFSFVNVTGGSIVSAANINARNTISRQFSGSPLVVLVAFSECRTGGQLIVANASLTLANVTTLNSASVMGLYISISHPFLLCMETATIHNNNN
jgi:hypothetical protein